MSSVRALTFALCMAATAATSAEFGEVFPRTLQCPTFVDGLNLRSNYRGSVAVFVATVTATELTNAYEQGTRGERYVNVRYELIEALKGAPPQTGVILTKTKVGGLCVFPAVSGQDYLFFIHDFNWLVPPEPKGTSLGEINVFGSVMLPHHPKERVEVLAPVRKLAKAD